jgi:orotidine-5'-phosphate decarboxylase
MKVFVKVAKMVDALRRRFSEPYGVSSFGIVVGATYPEDVKHLRELFPHLLFLIPGIGAQGGKMEDVRCAFLPGGQGALVNVSRDILFAYRQEGQGSGEDFALWALRKATFYQEVLKSLAG